MRLERSCQRSRANYWLPRNDGIKFEGWLHPLNMRTGQDKKNTEFVTFRPSKFSKTYLKIETIGGGHVEASPCRCYSTKVVYEAARNGRNYIWKKLYLKEIVYGLRACIKDVS